MVEYRFYSTFPLENRRKVVQAMDYITSKVSCITFHPKTIFPRRALHRPRQASPTDQCKILLAEDHHDG